MVVEALPKILGEMWGKEFGVTESAV